MTAIPEHQGTAAVGTGAASGRREGEIREALEQDAEQAAGAIDSERRDARHAQDRTDTQRRDAREAQDQINVQAGTQRRDAREAQDQIDVQAGAQRRDAREAQDQIDVQAGAQRRDARDAQDQINVQVDIQRRDAREAQDEAETAQDKERQDAQDSFDARRAGERREAFEQNVTDHQRADELEQANQTLEAANQNLEAFAYTVSHDLRAPLRAMNNYSAILLDEHGPALGEGGRACAEQIQAASQRMEQLIAALLRLARLSRAEVCLQSVDLGAEAVAVAAELQASEPRRRVRFAIQQPAWVMADRPLIRTVLQNLLGNAWKFTSGRDNAQIELWTTPDGDSRIRCHVRDNGAGFDPAQTGKLFTAFQRLHPASQFPGTGVGLASVRQIVEWSRRPRPGHRRDRRRRYLLLHPRRHEPSTVTRAVTRAVRRRLRHHRAAAAPPAPFPPARLPACPPARLPACPPGAAAQSPPSARHRADVARHLAWPDPDEIVDQCAKRSYS